MYFFFSASESAAVLISSSQCLKIMSKKLLLTYQYCNDVCWIPSSPVHWFKLDSSCFESCRHCDKWALEFINVSDGQSLLWYNTCGWQEFHMWHIHVHAFYFSTSLPRCHCKTGQVKEQWILKIWTVMREVLSWFHNQQINWIKKEDRDYFTPQREL